MEIGGAGDFKFYVYQDKDGTQQWHVIEHTTGVSLSSGKTRKEAIENAQATADRVGIDKLQEAVAKQPAIDDDQKRAALAKAGGFSVLSMAPRQRVDFRPISTEAAAGVVARIRPTAEERWNLELRLVPTFAALPQDVREAVARDYGEDERPRGVLHKGVVYLVADQHGSESELEGTILHEAIGHVGVRRLFGGQVTQQLNRLYLAIGGDRGIGRIAKRRGIQELGRYATALAESPHDDETRARLMMEEVLAHIAQEPQFMDRVKAILGAIRAWLRQHGFPGLAEYGETDLLHVLSQARQALETIESTDGPVVLARGRSTEAEEFARTERAYGGREAWEQAKAAGQTKLGFRQWVQVRTPAFKRWFGDWELAARRMPAVTLTLEGWHGNAAELGRLARKVYSDELQGTREHNDDLDADVLFSAEGKGVAFATSGNLRKPERAEMVRVLRQLVHHGVTVAQHEPDARRQRDSRMFYTLVAPLEVNGNALVAKITIREALADPDGKPHRFYDVTAIEMESGPEVSGLKGPASAESPLPTPSEPRTYSVAAMAKRINLDLSAGVSKVTDPATGEPLVVYHGSGKDLTSILSSADAGGWSGNRGIYFTPDPSYAAGYANASGRDGGAALYPVYVALHNPLTIERPTKEQESLLARLRDKVFRKAAEQRRLDAQSLASSSMYVSDGDLVELRERGHDGILNLGKSEIVAFEPTQIKSATGNSGDFDGTNPDIMASLRERAMQGMPLFSFAGESARTASLYELENAQQRLAQGEAAEAVRQATGWFRGADGKWRFEIGDREARLKDRFKDLPRRLTMGDALRTAKAWGERLTVGDVLEHPRLFAAYPQLADIRMVEHEGAGDGAFDVQNRTISIRHMTATNDSVSVLLHELQHAIQREEGFARGGSPRSAEAFAFGREYAKTSDEPDGIAEDKGARLFYHRLAGEVEARNVQTRQHMMDEERQGLAPNWTTDVADQDVIVLWEGKRMASEPANAGRQPGQTPAAIRAALVARFGEKGIAALERAGLLTILSFDQAPADLKLVGDEDAAYDPKTGRAYLFADRLSAETAPAKLLHELGEHAGLEGMLGSRDWRALKNRVALMAKNAGSATQAAWDGVKALYREFDGMSDATLSGNDRFIHEVVARLGETAAGRQTSLWRQIVARVKAWLAGLGLPVDLSEADVVQLVAGSLARVMLPPGIGMQKDAAGRVTYSNLGFAAGGRINGPGTPTSDSIPARVQETGEPIRVSTGERILSKDQDAFMSRVAKSAGYDSLDAMLADGTGKPVGPTLRAGKRAAADGLPPERDPFAYRPKSLAEMAAQRQATVAAAGPDQPGASSLAGAGPLSAAANQNYGNEGRGISAAQQSLPSLSQFAAAQGRNGELPPGITMTRDADGSLSYSGSGPQGGGAGEGRGLASIADANPTLEIYRNEAAIRGLDPNTFARPDAGPKVGIIAAPKSISDTIAPSPPSGLSARQQANFLTQMAQIDAQTRGQSLAHQATISGQDLTARGQDITSRGQDLVAREAATRLTGNPLDNQLKRTQLTEATQLTDLQSRYLAAQDPDTRDALGTQVRTLTGRSVPTERSLTQTQISRNAMIDDARERVAGMTPDEVKKRTAKFSATGRENPDYDPTLARAVNLSNWRKVGADDVFDSRQQGGQGQAQGQPVGDTAARFKADTGMKGFRLGQQTDRGTEVYDAQGRLVGHYN